MSLVSTVAISLHFCEATILLHAAYGTRQLPITIIGLNKEKKTLHEINRTSLPPHRRRTATQAAF